MNIYGEAIQILYDHNNSEQLLYEIAKSHPSAIVQAANRLKGPAIEDEVITMTGKGIPKIDCIKFYRQRTGAGLMEAKTAVEKLREKVTS